MKPHYSSVATRRDHLPQSNVPALKRRPIIKRRYATRGAEKIAIARIGSRQKGQKSSLTVAPELGESDVVARGIFNAEFAGAVESCAFGHIDFGIPHGRLYPIQVFDLGVKESRPLTHWR